MLPEIAKCSCNMKAELRTYCCNTDEHFACCPRRGRYDHLTCWSGPIRRTKREAILAWNKVMERCDDTKAKR